MAANRNVDRGGVLVSPLPRLDFAGGGFDHFLDAISRALRIGLAVLGFLRKRQNRDRNRQVPAKSPARDATKLPFGLSSTATSRRSRLETKPRASNSSRSSRSFSALRIGTRDKAQRSIGGIAMVVATAMATIIVNRLSLSAPIDSPMVATITSV